MRYLYPFYNSCHTDTVAASLSGNDRYASGSACIQLIKITDPSNSIIVGNLDTGGVVQSVKVFDRYFHAGVNENTPRKENSPEELKIYKAISEENTTPNIP